VAAERSDAERFIVHADEKLTAFLELEAAVRTALSRRPSGKRTRAGSNEYFSTMKAFFSIILAVTVSISTALAKHDGQRGRGGHHGKHDKHFSSIPPRGGHKASRSESKFSRGKSGKDRNWGGRNWRGGNWNGGYWSGSSRFTFIGGGYPYYWNWYPYWGWRYPYSYYSYYPSYWYAYDSCSVSRQRFFGP
jgi:hypothetical protein